MNFRDTFVEQFASLPGWGRFVPPPAPLAADEDPSHLITIDVPMARPKRTINTDNKIWNEISHRINAYPYKVSDQCSGKHYRDVFDFLRINAGIVDRVVECGTFQGGMSVLLAGCALAFDFKLDLIDVDPRRLQYTYHRLRLTFPECLDRIRLFFGEMPNYVKVTMSEPDFRNTVVHHDGSHILTTVIRDLSSLYYVRSKLHALLIQDTHLRQFNANRFWFVDAAVAAVFGLDPHYQPIGVTFPQTTAPGAGGVYFAGGRPEGMMLPIAENTFLYPHPDHTIDDFIQFPGVTAAAAA